MRRKKINLKRFIKLEPLILIIICFMVIGYSAISTVLNISGGVEIGFNFEDVNIYIANLYADGVNRYNSISEDKTEFSIEIENGTSEIEVYITNNATQYNEFASLNCSEAGLNGVTIVSDETNESLIYSQTINKFTYIVTNTAEKQTMTCRLQNEEYETDSLTKPVKKIIFAADGFENEVPYKYVTDKVYGELPTLSKEGYVFVGWYDVNGNLIEADSEIQLFSDEILFAKFELKNANTFIYNNSKTGIDCEEVQCALEELNKLVDKGV